MQDTPDTIAARYEDGFTSYIPWKPANLCGDSCVAASQ